MLTTFSLSSARALLADWSRLRAEVADEGAASRGEATDAAMGQRAECVMLNKGPHQVEAIAFLDDVLRRMDRHQYKKAARLAPLGSWTEPQTL